MGPKLFAGHFFDAVFAEQHNLALAEGEQGPMLVFCPRDTRRPSIQGHIRLDAAHAPASVTWRFLTRQPEEEAGGEVFFAVQEDVQVVPLVGLYWRKRIYDYYQEWWEFHRWGSCATDPDHQACRGRARSN